MLPSVVVFFTAYFLLKTQSDETLAKMRMDIQRQNQSTITPIKLQAYERLTLFLERISPQQLIMNNNQPDMSAKLLRYQMTNVVHHEYNYNLSQQIYVSTQAWNVIKVVKEQVLAMINESAENLPDTATGVDLSKAIIERLMQTGEQPTDKGIAFLKAEVGLFFG
jgi:hypothetical protein